MFRGIMQARFDPRYLRIFSDGASSDGAGDDGKEGPDKDPNAGDDGGKTFTQDELDAIIDKRLKRERKKWQDTVEEEKRKAQMTEQERLKAEKEDAEKRARDAEARFNERLIKAEAKAVAAELGIKAERVNYLLKLADLDGIEVDDGEVDAGVIKASIQKVVTDMPELLGKKAANTGDDFSQTDQTKVLTLEDVKNMNPEELDKNWSAVSDALTKGTIRKNKRSVLSVYENFIPEVWSGRIFVALKKALVLGNVVNRDYEGEISQFGDTVKINSVGPVAVRDYTKDTDITFDTLEDAQMGLHGILLHTLQVTLEFPT